MGWTATQTPGTEAGHQLAVAAMLNVDNSLIEEEVVMRVVARHETEKWMPEVDDKDLEAVVRDTLLIGEQDEALKELSKRRSTISAQALRPKVSTMYKKAVQDLDKDHWKKGHEARRAKTKEEDNKSKAFTKAYDRVYAKLNSTVDERVKSMLPSTVGIYTDQGNGRWKISFRTAAVQMARSISWTQVGQSAAARVCILQGWSWVEVHEGREAPGNLQERLQKAFPV